MAKFDKPEVPNVVWASNALDIDVVKPTDDEVKIGWEQEKPPYQIENWSMRKLHQAVAYFNQHGIPEWDRNTEYQQGKSFVQADDGVIYRCKQTNRGRNPSEGTNPDYWEQFRGDRLATTEKVGVVELATIAEVAAGVRDDVVVTPHTLGEGYVGNPVGTVLQFAGTNAPAGYFECDGRAVSRADYNELFSVIGTTYGAGNGSSTFNIPDLRGEFVRGWDHGRGADAGRRMGSSQGDQIQSHNHSGSTGYDGRHSHSGSTSTSGSHYHNGSTSTNGHHDHGAGASTAGNHTHRIPEGQTEGSDGYGNNGLASGDDFTPHVGDWSTSQGAGAHSHHIDVYPAGNHYHSFNTSWAGNHSHSVSINSAGNHNHSFSTSYTGGGETRPRNVAMMFCIKYE